MKLFSKFIFVSSTLVVLLFIFTLFSKPVSAATLNSVKDILGTSRPSASSPISDALPGQLANDTNVTVVDNGSIFLASDSAQFRPDTGETLNTVNVASMSAASGGNRTVYMTGTIANAHHKGDPVVVPISSLHSITFTTGQAVPTLGTITIAFPTLTTGDANNPASPSATTFQLNGLADAQVKINGLSGAATFTGTYTNPTNGTSPIIQIALTGTTNIAAGATITVLLGCTTQVSGTCTVPSPKIINPTKLAAAGTGDSWRMTIQTRDVTGASDLDNATIKIATIDSTQVYATVEPSLTVTIAGLTSGDNNLTVGAGTCGSETSVNTGIDATATVVNLGVLANGILSRSAQSITVSTNGAAGYAVTATSSGRLINPSTGNWILDANGGSGLTANDTPAPAAMSSGIPAFGISPCGARVSTTSPNWGASPNTATFGGTPARFSNPWNTGTGNFQASIASYSGGPVSSDKTVVRYGATISGTTQPGVYATVLTYVVTATF